MSSLNITEDIRYYREGKAISLTIQEMCVCVCVCLRESVCQPVCVCVGGLLCLRICLSLCLFVCAGGSVSQRVCVFLHVWQTHTHYTLHTTAECRCLAPFNLLTIITLPGLTGRWEVVDGTR